MYMIHILISIHAGTHAYTRATQPHNQTHSPFPIVCECKNRIHIFEICTDEYTRAHIHVYICIHTCNATTQPNTQPLLNSLRMQKPHTCIRYLYLWIYICVHTRVHIHTHAQCTSATKHTDPSRWPPNAKTTYMYMMHVLMSIHTCKYTSTYAYKRAMQSHMQTHSHSWIVYECTKRIHIYGTGTLKKAKTSHGRTRSPSSLASECTKPSCKHVFSGV